MRKSLILISYSLLLINCKEKTEQKEQKEHYFKHAYEDIDVSQEKTNLFVNNDFNPNDYVSIATNPLGEVLVVMDREYWSNEIGQNLKSDFEGLITTTPLPYEKEFKLDFIEPKGLIKNMKNHNCILNINIDKSFQNSLTVPNPVLDKWAKGQIVFDFKLKNKKSAVKFFKYNSDKIKRLINDFYHKQITQKFGSNSSINNTLINKYGFSLKIPKKMLKKKSSKDLTWLSLTTFKKDQNGVHEIQQGLFIYEYSYNDTSQFSLENQIKTRDNLLKKHVRIKDKKEAYMTTIKEEDGGNFSHTSYLGKKNQYTVEFAGLFSVVNYKMGGPFISISRLNPSKTKIITIEGYVYAPYFKKRKLLRELKAMIYSLEWK